MALHVYTFPATANSRPRRFYSFHMRDSEMKATILCVAGCALSVGMLLGTVQAVFAGAVIGVLVMAVTYLIYAQNYRIPLVVAEGLSKEKAGVRSLS